MANVMVVEDCGATRTLLGEVASVLGHTPETFDSAESARERLIGDAPDLVFIDIGLPQEHGISFAWSLHQQWPEVPIVVLSAHLEDWEDEDLSDCGVHTALPKPLCLPDLHRLFAALHEQGDALGKTLKILRKESTGQN